jgi:hypothetical protein
MSSSPITITRPLAEIYEEYAEMMEQDTEFDDEYLRYIFDIEKVDQE